MQELYSKAFVAGSIKFAISDPRVEKDKNDEEKFTCNLATILARDEEVIAVCLKLFTDKCVVHISKNKAWERPDTAYVHQIKEYLQNISRDAPVTLDTAFNRNDVKRLFKAIMDYCSTKFKSRLEKLKEDITKGPRQYILPFKTFAKIEDVGEARGYKMSGICSSYYKTVKDETVEDKLKPWWEKFLRHLKKVGSYDSALINITACACNAKYKDQFSDIVLVTLNPVIVYRQPIFSWANIIHRFISSDKMYEKFKERCLGDKFILERLKEIYGTDSNTNPQLDNEKNERLYSHAEMNIMTYIIDQGNKKPAFIAVSKYCCFLCELYIKFTRSKGYQIFTSGAHNKLYHRWLLPNTKDITFKNDALKYMIADLDQIIRGELKQHVDIKARSDSEGKSGGEEHIDRAKVNELYETLEESNN